MGNYTGVLGIVLILAVAFAWSENRRAINWRLPIIGIPLAFVLGLLMLKVPGTSDAVLYIGTAVNKLADHATVGAVFGFGDTITFGKFYKPEQAVTSQEFVFAIRIGMTIIFVCGLCSLGYYFGILQWVVRGMGWALRRTFGLSGAESLSCAASCWVGQVEAQMLIRPYMPNLTRSELFTSMTNSMAVAAGSALVLYMSLGINSKWLIAASLMSTINSIVLAKIIIPETQHDQIQRNVTLEVERGEGFFDAMEKGAMQGLRIAVNVMVMVMFAIAFISMINGGLEAVLGLFGLKATVKDVLGYPMAPVSWLVGVPWNEAVFAGKLIGTELAYNEVVSYSDMMEAVRSGLMTERTQAIMTCALCGFAHLGSIGIQIGGLGAMAPERRTEIAKYAFKAMIVANMATWLSAAQVSLIF